MTLSKRTTSCRPAVPLRQVPSLRARRRAAQRGFTLIELLVALLAGLFVAMAAFLLARNATRFFQHESRIAAAQYASMMGAGRIQVDLQRAAYLAPTNAPTDPRRCGNMSDWPDGLKLLSSVTIEEGGSVSNHGGDHGLTVANGLNPDSIIIGGALHTSEVYVASKFEAAGGALDILLQTDDGPMARTLAAAGASGQSAESYVKRIFADGRFLRLVDPEDGLVSWAVIDTFTWPVGGPARISLFGAPVVPDRAIYEVCGYVGFGTGTLVNPVSRVRYDLRSIDTSNPDYEHYSGMFESAGHAASDRHKGVVPPQRTELVRVELDAHDVEMPETLEILAEFAVDLKFGLSRVLNPATTPTLDRYPVGDPQVYVVAGAIDAGGTPEQIRSVQVRLSTRAAQRDRDTNIPAPAAGGLYRFGLGPDAGFARVRTLITDVALPNAR